MYERLKKAFAEMNVDGEIIFVNDASPDDAEQVLRELAARDESVVVINHSRNFGSQAAFTSGMHWRPVMPSHCSMETCRTRAGANTEAFERFGVKGGTSSTAHA